MELIKILNQLEYKSYNFKNINIFNLFVNSKNVTKDSIFFAIDGVNTNGSLYVTEAVKNGAKVVVCSSKLKTNICQIVVKDVRKALAVMCANFYNNVHKKLKLIAVVGTNGKTSTTKILGDILSYSGKKVGLIGTNFVSFNGTNFEHNLTTPDTLELFKIFKQMVDCNVQYVVMEVSAHAIYLQKVYGLIFDFAIFTNFSQDHLDFFGDMQSYMHAKTSFFNDKQVKTALLNVDYAVGRQSAQQNNINGITYGIKTPSDVFANGISMDLTGCKFVVNYLDDVFFINSNLTCLFNVYNILASICVCKQLGIDNTTIQKSLLYLKQIDGRFNLLNFGQNFNVILDYAHTPESLKNLLENINNLNKNKTIVVFGCPGNRDELKREIMGEIAGRYSDYVIITTDNPQYENSYRIMRNIERGVYKTNCPYKLIDNRSDAINLAFSLASPKSNVVIVGKGNETYQNINGEHVAYSDYNTIKQKLEVMKKLKLDNKFLF